MRRRWSDQRQTRGGGGAIPFHLTRGRHLHHTAAAAANLNTALPLQLMAAVTGLNGGGGGTTAGGVGAEKKQQLIIPAAATEMLEVSRGFQAALAVL